MVHHFGDTWATAQKGSGCRASILTFPSRLLTKYTLLAPSTLPLLHAVRHVCHIWHTKNPSQTHAKRSEEKTMSQNYRTQGKQLNTPHYATKYTLLAPAMHASLTTQQQQQQQQQEKQQKQKGEVIHGALLLHRT